MTNIFVNRWTLSLKKRIIHILCAYQYEPSATVIAALELKFPADEEKKNSICTVYPPPQMPEDFFQMFLADWKTNQAITKILGLQFLTSRRIFNFNHVGYIELLKFLYLGELNIKIFNTWKPLWILVLQVMSRANLFNISWRNSWTKLVFDLNW